MYQAQQVQRLAGPGINLLGAPIQLLGQPPGLRGVGGAIFGALALASVAASAYHGVKRNGGSIGWGAVWGAAGAAFPVITPAIAAAQGFAKCKNNCGVRGYRRRRALRGPVTVWGS